jgi:hypothetical protein
MWAGVPARSVIAASIREFLAIVGEFVSDELRVGRHGRRFFNARVRFSRVWRQYRSWREYVTVRGLVMTVMIAATAVIVGLTLWYPRSVPTDAPDEKYPPAATSAPLVAPPLPAPPVAPPVAVSAPASPATTKVVESPVAVSTRAPAPTYAPPLATDVPTATATSEAPPPSVAPSTTRPHLQTNVTRSKAPVYMHPPPGPGS